MVKKFIVGLLASLLATAAGAQSFPVPPDVGTYIPVPQLYKTDGTANVVIDPSVTPPPQAGLTNIPVSTTVGRVSTGDGSGPGSPFCLTALNGGACTEAKMRTLIGGTHTHILNDDPIRAYNVFGGSHCHEFFGNLNTTASSTYKSLRTYGASDAAGYDVNGTGYWFPCPILTNPLADGHDYVARLKFASVYYLESLPADGRRDAHIPPGLRYVFGFEMDDQWAWLQTVLTAANTTQGHTRYTLTNPGTGMMSTEGFYTCAGATATGVNAVPGQASSSKVIANADGTDPYGGTCASGADYFINIGGSNCWDGTNLWSPGGYKHVIPLVWDADFSKMVCPSNYYRLPTLSIELHFSQQGWTDRQRWRLSSDSSYATTCGCTVANGFTFHEDWFDGWADEVRQVWEDNCIGTLNHTPHECNGSTISSDGHMIGGLGSENGPVFSPQVDIATDYFTNAANKMFRKPVSSQGPKTMNMH